MSPSAVVETLREYRSTGDRRLRNEVVEAHMHLVEYYVSLHSRKGVVAADDLRQTGLLALIGAVERFDENAGASLTTFATRCIDGELKRHLRDRTWLVRPPRSAQETHLHLGKAREQLSHSLGRSPTVAELSAHLDLDEEQVIMGIVAGCARVNESIDRPARSDSGSSVADALLGDEDRNYELSDSLLSLRGAMERLGARQRQILELRFGEDLSQTEIAEAIGVSQSYVSRILHGALSTLRAELG